MISFRFAGVRWRVSFWFFGAVALFLFVDAGGFALSFLGAAAIHECGHLLAMGFLKAPVRVVELTLFGMKICRGGRVGRGAEIIILLAGAGGNLLAALVLYFWGAPGIMEFSAANTALAIFHLLPVAGLDGGSLLELFCLNIFGPASGGVIAGGISVTFCFAALAALVWVVFYHGVTGGLLMMGLLLILALFAPLQ